ncbi:MAG: hypothetical protein AAFZ07_00260 [Actinomycetota bacterium]
MAGRPRLLTRAPRLGVAVDRPRLLALAGRAPVVVLAAPEGSGCTTVAAQLAVADGGTVAWCRLTSGYDTAADVVQMVADGLDAEIGAARRVIDLAEQLLDLFDRGPLTVVIDDQHLAADGDLDRVIAECVELLPDDGRIVVAAAARPAGLIGLVPPGRRVVLGAAELAFDEAEAEALFEQHGAPVDVADRWRQALGGWAQAMAAGAHAPETDPAQHVAVPLAQLRDADPSGGRLVDALAAVAYLTADLAASLGLDLPAGVVEESPILTDHGGYVRMAAVAAVAHRSGMDDAEVARLRVAAGTAIAGDDPTTAIDLLLDAGEPDAAADVLAGHLSEIGVERALTWLYRLPAELRRRFPPVLAAGQATVEVDAALADAELRVAQATTERSRREALLALGSVEAHRGELAAAATAFESALRAARDDEAATARIAAELAGTRWLLGDLLGARAALADAPSTGPARWLGAQLDVVEGETGEVDPPGGDPFDLAAAALRALGRGDDATAAPLADDAYAGSVDAGGEAFVAASAVRGLALVRRGAHDEALLVAETLERRSGPRHQLARVHGAILRERCSRATSHPDHDRDARRLRDLRARGYASIEQLADRVLDGGAEADAGAGGDEAEVRVLGDHEVRCDGRTVRRSDWKSKKALEVLTVIASHGRTGGRREQVIEAVWPDRPPEKGRTLLRTALSEIRRRLEPDRPAGEASRHLTASDDMLRFGGVLDLDLVEGLVVTDPGAAFSRLRSGLAPSVAAAEWAQDWPGRVERLTIRAATAMPADAEAADRIVALEALIAAEPWQRDHYDALAGLHRAGGDEGAAAEVERRWFADE